MRFLGLARAVSALAAGFVVAIVVPTAAAGAAVNPATAIVQSTSPAATAGNAVGTTPAGTTIKFRLGMQLSDPAGAEALAWGVSDPASPDYGRYVTPAQWEQRFSPPVSAVDSVVAWLVSQGAAVEGVTPDRMSIDASAPAAVVEQAFVTQLAEYRAGGGVLRLASKPLRMPSNLAPLITGVAGIDATHARPAGVRGADAPTGPLGGSAPARAGEAEPGPTPGFRISPPCSQYYGQLRDSVDPPYGGGYPPDPPYAPCGYVPSQLQGAYGLGSPMLHRASGKGVTVAIVDAYASPMLLSDTQKYSERHQLPSLLAPGQFTELVNRPFDRVEECDAESPWFNEQALDVEAVHAMAPAAKILYVAAHDCYLGLYEAVQQIVDGHLAQVINDSWLEPGGDVITPAEVRHAFDNVLIMAAATGVSVQFSSGDFGDEFAFLGKSVADYPASSPFVTSVGGTDLEVGAHDTRVAEAGWSNSGSYLCAELIAEPELPGCNTSTFGTWLPPAPGEHFFGGGGGTSYSYPEPAYQKTVVPEALADRNSAITNIANRVEPDISLDGDPGTGMLVGVSQVFPDGTHYNETRYGGTSLASPLLSGLIADADQAAHKPLGFLNPLLYKLARQRPGPRKAFKDIVPENKAAFARVDYLNGIDNEIGTYTSMQTLDYEGPEIHCGEEGCAEQPGTLHVAPGFDSMTGIGSPGPGFIAALAVPVPAGPR